MTKEAAEQQPDMQVGGEPLDIRSLFKLFRAVAQRGGYRHVTLVKCAHLAHMGLT